jgi:hypothetical protein
LEGGQGLIITLPLGQKDKKLKVSTTTNKLKKREFARIELLNETTLPLVSKRGVKVRVRPGIFIRRGE